MKGIVVGITLDFGPVPLYGGLEDETDTQGLDGLDDKCKKYKVCEIYSPFVISFHSKMLTQQNDKKYSIRLISENGM